MKTLKLRKPLLVNGMEMTELKYDYDAITANDILTIGSRQPMREPDKIKLDFDDPYRCGQVFFKAVTRAMPEVAEEDLLRLSGRDMAAGVATGQDFFADSYIQAMR